MFFLLPLFLLLPGLAKADFVASAGLVGGSFESKEESLAGNPLLEVSSYFGFRGGAEFGNSYVSLFGTFDLGKGNANTEYDYENPDNSSDQAQVSNLDTAMWLSRASGGLRLRFIKLKTFRMYAGAGLEYGVMNLVYDKEDFKSKRSSTTGFEEGEKRNFRGWFGQLGMEFILDSDTGFRLQVQKDYFRTDAFETLNQKRLNFETTTFSLSFMQYIDM